MTAHRRRGVGVSRWYRDRTPADPRAPNRYRPGRPAPDGVQGWAALHGGIRPSALVRLWLRGVQRLAAGPVARVSPDALSVAGVAAAGGAAVVAAQSGRWPLVAAALVVLAGCWTGSTARSRCALAGRGRSVPSWMRWPTASATCSSSLPWPCSVHRLPGASPPGPDVLHEYLRARAGAAGMPGVGALTVAERPTRLVLAAVACLGAGTLPAGTPLTGWNWATVCAIGWVAVAAVGFVHLSIGVARTTPRHFPDDDPA